MGDHESPSLLRRDVDPGPVEHARHVGVDRALIRLWNRRDAGAVVRAARDRDRTEPVPNDQAGMHVTGQAVQGCRGPGWPPGSSAPQPVREQWQQLWVLTHQNCCGAVALSHLLAEARRQRYPEVGVGPWPVHDLLADPTPRRRPRLAVQPEIALDIHAARGPGRLARSDAKTRTAGPAGCRSRHPTTDRGRAPSPPCSRAPSPSRRRASEMARQPPQVPPRVAPPPAHGAAGRAVVARRTPVSIQQPCAVKAIPPPGTADQRQPDEGQRWRR